ncbi:threonine synthase [Candida albicans]|uniref:Threonine synthase n=1 Tax=Candida albicans TaxID=5476 RepID=A0A8H6BTP2_CANAX|nr:threonine synthase [Candida albicans]
MPSSSQVYRSTRSSQPEELSFEDVDFLSKWADLSFNELAFEILRLYINENEIPNADLKDLITRSYSTFRSSEVTPLKKLDDNLYILELFHGPTYAFKDVALQFVGNLFEYFLTRRNAQKDLTKQPRDIITVVGATSGDTGSAAIYGLRGKKDVSVFILYPTGRISPIQEEQMTTVEDENVHTLSVNGTFDDCQDIVKSNFGTTNILFLFLFQLQKQAKTTNKVRFVVPSGNFGDILAGYYAYRMGLPVDKLIIATNENDILDRFIKSGEYAKEQEVGVKATYSPAMDILISSNFERLLWYLIRDNVPEVNKSDEKAGQLLNDWMKQLKEQGKFKVPAEVIDAARQVFDSQRVDNDTTVQTIKQVYDKSADKYVIDPHTAVGVTTSYSFIAKDTEPIQYISLSTAHPAKFSEVVNKALDSFDGYSFDKDVLPAELKA